MNATNMTPAEVAAWEDLARTGKLRYALATENEWAYQAELARHAAKLFPPAQPVVVAQERPKRHPLVIKHRKREENAVATTRVPPSPDAARRAAQRRARAHAPVPRPGDGCRHGHRSGRARRAIVPSV